MNNIAPSVAISASPAVLAVPLRDCDVYYPTFSFFPRPRPSPVCGGLLPGMILGFPEQYKQTENLLQEVGLPKGWGG